MNVVDSSAWLEYFAGGSNAGFFAVAIEDSDRLVVPTVCLYEVFKSILRQRGKKDALEKTAAMRQATVVDFDTSLAFLAASLALTHRLALADSVVLATARARGAVLWTQDADFADLPGVKFKSKGR
ncbi:MAG: type II toxin-antitoxin system VapC family toxin [Deltaproteobacteria bacterium]|nr:type II toxin-antitoxin system VapC family toxin [Deltaproteobacteria bacterium]